MGRPRCPWKKFFFTIAKNYSWPKEGFLYKHSTLDPPFYILYIGFAYNTRLRPSGTCGADANMCVTSFRATYRHEVELAHL